MAIVEDSGNKKKSVITADKSSENDKFEVSLRPNSFVEYIGQENIKNNLRVFIQASQNRGENLEHTLFYGPPGLGKTTLANIIAKEMKANLRITSGPAIEKPGDLAAIISNLKVGDVLFIDEIHRLRLPVEEILYTAMEDFAIDLIVGKGPSARTMRLDVPRFTLIGATTKVSMLSNPLRDRFGHVEKLSFYEDQEIVQILSRSAKILNTKIDQKSLEIISKSSRKTPRIANRLLRRVRDFAEIENFAEINSEITTKSLKNLSIDSHGLDKSDQEFLNTLCQKFNGGPVGLSTLSSATGEDSATIEDVIEPFLIREGFLQKTNKGRIATKLAWEHLGLKNSFGI